MVDGKYFPGIQSLAEFCLIAAEYGSAADRIGLGLFVQILDEVVICFWIYLYLVSLSIECVAGVAGLFGIAGNISAYR